MGFFGGVSAACPYKSQKECTAVSTCSWTKGKRTYCRKNTRKSNGRKSPKKSPAKSPAPWSSVLSSLKRSNRNKKSPAKSPKKSPAKSPKKSPAKSPKKSPAKSPKKSPAKSPKKSPAKSPKKSPAKSPTNGKFTQYINWMEDPRNAADELPADLNSFTMSAELTRPQMIQMDEARKKMMAFKHFYKSKKDAISKGFMSPSFNDSPYDSMVKEYLSKH